MVVKVVVTPPQSNMSTAAGAACAIHSTIVRQSSTGVKG